MNEVFFVFIQQNVIYSVIFCGNSRLLYYNKGNRYLHSFDLKGVKSMTITQIIVLLAVLAMLILMIIEIAHPATIAFITLLFFFVIGYISPDEIMSTISNEGVLTLALLFIVTSVIEKTNVMEKILFLILKKSKSEKGVMMRLTPPLIGFSAFFNNTPLVVILTSSMQNWCKERNLHASKFLLPISYLTIFGGMFTIIGTSTNLIVHGWLLDKGFEGFSFFQLAPYISLGVSIGVVYLALFSSKILPVTDTAMSERYEDGRNFLFEAVVEENCSLIGKTVMSEEFNKLKNLYLLKILRDNEVISPIRLNDKIQVNDILIFSGQLDRLENLERFKNLSIRTDEEMSMHSLQSKDSKLIEAVVSHNSTIIHTKIKHSNFRSMYDAAIVSVHRKNENINKNIGDIRLKPGDVLLLLVGKDFELNASQTGDFYALTEIHHDKALNKKQSILAVATFSAMILSVALGFLSMFTAVLLCIGLFMLFDFFDSVQIKRSIPFPVLLLIVASLGIGKVIESTGVADLIANTMIGLIAENFGMIGLLAGIYLITNILTEVITNTAAAVIVLPISLEVATYLDISPVSVAVIVAVAASASFSTPIGYQTNLIVYGPGGYKFSDYLKLGLPLNIIFMVTVILSAYVLM